MATMTVTLQTGSTRTINSEEVSRIYERNNRRDIYLGPGNVETTVLSVTNPMATLISSLGNLKSLTELNTNKILAVNTDFISRVLDDYGSSRNVWFGPGQIVGTTSDVVAVKETSVAMHTLLGLPKVTHQSNGRIHLINPSYVSRVDSGSTWRNIWTGEGNVAGIYASVTSVKETVAQLKSMGIG